MSTRYTANVSFPAIGVIGLCLVIAKLGGIEPIASWSWWLVTLPFWFGIVVFVAVFVIFILFAAVVFILSRFYSFLKHLFGK